MSDVESEEGEGQEVGEGVSPLPSPHTISVQAYAVTYGSRTREEGTKQANVMALA